MNQPGCLRDQAGCSKQNGGTAGGQQGRGTARHAAEGDRLELGGDAGYRGSEMFWHRSDRINGPDVGV